MGAQAIDYHSDLAKETNEQIGICFTTRTAFRKLIDNGHDMNKDRQFFSGVRPFYVEPHKYARSHLPLEDPILKNARLVNFTQRESAELSQVEYFVKRYPSILPLNSDPALMDKLKDELLSYQLLEESDVPADVWKKLQCTWMILQHHTCIPWILLGHTLQPLSTPVSYTHLTLPTNREV